MLIFRGHNADIDRETSEGLVSTGTVKEFGWIDGNYEDLKELNAQLEHFDMPPLSEWNYDGDGRYGVQVFEDAEGTTDEEGEFSIYYRATVMETPSPIPFDITRKRAGKRKR